SPLSGRLRVETSSKLTVKLDAESAVGDATGVEGGCELGTAVRGRSGALVGCATGVRVGVAVGAPLSMTRLSKFVFQPLLLANVTVLHTPIQPIGTGCCVP